MKGSAAAAFLIQNFLGLAKNCQSILKISELASANVWNVPVMKVVDVYPGYDSKMVDHIGNSTFVLKLVSGSFCIRKCNLRVTLLPVAYFGFILEFKRMYMSFVVSGKKLRTYIYVLGCSEKFFCKSDGERGWYFMDVYISPLLSNGRKILNIWYSKMESLELSKS